MTWVEYGQSIKGKLFEIELDVMLLYYNTWLYLQRFGIFYNPITIYWEMWIFVFQKTVFVSQYPQLQQYISAINCYCETNSHISIVMDSS